MNKYNFLKEDEIVVDELNAFLTYSTHFFPTVSFMKRKVVITNKRVVSLQFGIKLLSLWFDNNAEYNKNYIIKNVGTGFGKIIKKPFVQIQLLNSEYKIYTDRSDDLAVKIKQLIRS